MTAAADQRRRRVPGACGAQRDHETAAGATSTVGFFAAYLQGVIDGRGIAR